MKKYKFRINILKLIISSFKKSNIIKESNIFYFKSFKGKKKVYSYKIIIILFLSILLFFLLFDIGKKDSIKKYNNNLLFPTNNNKTIINHDFDLTNYLIKKLNETYEKQGFVNINKIESTISRGRLWAKLQNNSSEINVGSTFDENYIFLSMMTIASIMDSQKIETKVRFHFGVVDGFSVESMLKIYLLRERIREDVEFNFYNAKKVETELKGVHPKGNAVCARLLLPELLPDDVERLIMFDTGDVLILRDLSEMYKWNMEEKIYVGVLDYGYTKYGKISGKKLNIYINAGNYLIDIKKVKFEKMYNQFVKYKNTYMNSRIADQELLNDVAYGKIGYMPMKFGLMSPFKTDYKSDKPPYNTQYNFFGRGDYKKKYPFLPKNQNEMNLQAYNPVVIHQWNGKWTKGIGLSIYRRMAQNYLKISGIWNEACQKYPKLCIKR